VSEPQPELPAEFAALLQTYIEMFGVRPTLPEARFEFSSTVNPDFLRILEKLRAHAFHSEVFDMKTTQLILFGMLMVEGHQAAQMHALAARRAGATWEELHKIVELAAATRSLMPSNQGFAMLNTLRKQESGGAPSA
jgi:alkylhydroperoxidase/carboxymuconolactone decarboxylase family protein YurZ